MVNSEKYREIRITYVHIVTLIIAFIAIGMLLFFLGYRIGKGSVERELAQNADAKGNKKVVQIYTEDNTVQTGKQKRVTQRPRRVSSKAKQNNTSEIAKELQMHNTIGMQKKKPAVKQQVKQKEKETVIKPKKISRSTYYAIQIGAFRDHKGAKREAQKFMKAYATEIIKSGELYKVRIGSFKTQKSAMQEIKRNPRLKGCYPVRIKR